MFRIRIILLLFAISAFFINCSDTITSNKSSTQYRILFSTGDIYSINEDGTNIIQHTIDLFSHSPNPIWTSDASQIIFEKFGHVYIKDYDNQQLINLTNNISDFSNFSEPTLSPDGQILAFVASSPEYSEYSDICTIDINGQGYTNLTLDEVSNYHPIWAPNGQYILYCVGDTIIVGNNIYYKAFLYIMNSDGSGKRIVNNLEHVCFYRWTNNSQQIVYTNDQYILKIIDIDGTGKSVLSDTSKIVLWHDCSPINSQIVFCYNSDATEDELYIMNYDGSNIKKLTSAENLNRPIFSPDGAKILYSENLNMYVININSLNKRKVTSNNDNIWESDFCWSPIKVKN